MLQVFTHANFPLMGRTKIVFGLFSLAACIVAVYGIAHHGFNYGIDFAGGTAVQLKFREAPPLNELRAALDKAGLGDISLQQIGEQAEHEVLVRAEQEKTETGEGGNASARILGALRTVGASAVPAGGIDLNIASENDLREWLQGRATSAAAAATDAAAVAAAVVKHRNSHGGVFASFDDLASIPGVSAEQAAPLKDPKLIVFGPFALRSVDYVGPTAGAELLRNTGLAILGSVVGILIYVWFRFNKWIWGLGAVIALVHDVLIAAGAVALTGKEFSLAVVASLLTIVGYSINDTIVIYDRIRENLRLYRDVDFETIVNASVNQTLSRTILTSFTVFIAVAALFLYGGEKLNPMSFCLLVGVVFGTYSSVFVASALLVVAYRRLGAKTVRG